PAQRVSLIDQIQAEAYGEIGKPQPIGRARSRGERTIQPAPDIPTPPFWGSRLIDKMPLEIVLKYLHKPELYRLSWGAKNAHGEEWDRLEAEFEQRLARMAKAALHEHTLRPQAVYGFFPANSDGDDLIIWDPAPFASANGHAPEQIEIARFAFPRQPFGEYLCISDYYAPLDSGKVDTVALQIVTVGEVATQQFEKLQSRDEYTEAYFFHGLAVQAAEATANYVNRMVVNRQLSIPTNRGKRYSWGYPACPDLQDHETVLRLLPQAESALSMMLTPAYQWVPEQSTAAIVVHHPDAKYFNVGSADRTPQIMDSE
ncbi:MAG: methionine synthase, partial [Anaerolineae bacterium]|nr:methionine synthase [Anaerolineae bacterium]